MSAVAVLLATSGGPLATPDTMSYVGAAEALVSRGKLNVPMAEWSDEDSTTALQQFPPGYPVAVAAGIAAGASPRLAVRWVAAGAALITVTTLSALAAQAVGAFAGVLMPLLLLSVRGIPTAHLTALSEPLFLAAFAATVVLMASVPDRPLAYGATAALGSMVRYAGMSLIGAAIIWALVWTLAQARAPGTSRRSRVVPPLCAAAWAALPGALVNVAWLVRARRAEFDTPVSTMAWMGDVAPTLAKGGRTLIEHLAPVPLPWLVRAVVAACVAVALIALLFAGARASRAERGALERRLSIVSALVACCYILVLLYSRLFVGQTIVFDDRLLAPLFVCILLAAVVAAGTVWRAARPRGSGPLRVGATLAAAWLGASVAQSTTAAARSLTGRRDYWGRDWQSTPTAGWLRDQGRRYSLFTDNPPAAYFVTGRPSRTLPETMDPDTVRAFGQTLRRSGGAIVEYGGQFVPVADAATLARTLGLCPIVRSRGGIVWVPSPDAPARGAPCPTRSP